MGEARTWAALVIEASQIGQDDFVAAVLDDFSPAAIEDLTPQPLPPAGLWDSTSSPPPDPPPAPLRWRVFFDSGDTRDRAASALAEQLPGLHIEAVEVADEDWAARSQEVITAIRAGQFIVAPPWDVPSNPGLATTIIVIHPSRGFGTGHHPSTRLCLRALSEIDVTGRRVLDLGTGSGVLAMAAAFKRARAVVGLDVDPDAIEAARESAALNALPVEIEFVVGDFRTPAAWRAASPEASAVNRPHPYDIVLANLTGGLLIRSASAITELVAPGGVLVMGGFDESERPVVRAAFVGFDDVAAYAEEGWVGLALRSDRP